MSDNILRDAVEQIPGHWTKFVYHTPDEKKHCAMGHLQNVSGMRGEKFEDIEWESVLDRFCTARDILESVVREQFSDRFSAGWEKPTIPQFNDHQDTTEADVVAVFEKAAVKWDERV